MKKVLYIGLGTISLGCGIVGIVVPGLPTTPFVLLAAWFYLRSSNKLHQQLINHRLLGRYITEYSRGVTRKTKFRIFTLMWTMVLISSFIFIHSWSIRTVVLLAAAAGTAVVWSLREPQE